MTDLESALAEAAGALDECSIPLSDAVACLCSRLIPRSAEPLRFVETTRVLPLQSSSGIRLDIVFGILPFEQRGISRAVRKEIAGRWIPVASVEDLVLMKLASEREKDLNDARSLLRRHRQSLDRDYLAPQLEELAQALARPDILEIFHREW